MPVVRSGGEEQPVLEPRRDLADGSGDVRVDCVALAAGWGGMVRFVKDKQAARTEIAQPGHERRSIRIVNEQALGDEESGVRRPRIHAEASLAADVLDVILVKDLEGEPK